MDLETNTFLPLEICDYLEKTAGGGVSIWSKHLMKGLNVNLGVSCQPGKPYRGIDIVTQEFFAERDLTTQ